jgi:hypothetical protein
MMLLPICSLVGALALPVALSPSLDNETRNAALRVLYKLEVPLDAHATRLLRLSPQIELQDELQFVLIGCISDLGFADALNHIPLDVIDTEYVMSVYGTRLGLRQRAHGSVKPFLYRVIRRDDPRSAPAAVGRLADWCDLDLLDHAFLHYLAWCRTIDVRTAALRTLAEWEGGSLLLALGVLACSSITADSGHMIDLLAATDRLGPYRPWACARIDFTFFLAHQNGVIVENTLKLMRDARVYSACYLPQVLSLMASGDQITRTLARSWLVRFAERCVYLGP